MRDDFTTETAEGDVRNALTVLQLTATPFGPDLVVYDRPDWAAALKRLDSSLHRMAEERRRVFWRRGLAALARVFGGRRSTW